MTEQTSFTGRARQRKTKKSVMVSDVASRWIITVGGIGTIVAVCTVAAFLLVVVWPLLFEAEHVDREYSGPLPWEGDGRVIHLATDEFRIAGWAMFDDGHIRVFDLRDGHVLEERDLFPDAKPTAWAFGLGKRHAVFGFADGTIRFGQIGLVTQFVPEEQLPDSVKQLKQGEVARFRKGLVERTPADQFRLQEMKVELEDPIAAADTGIALIDHIALTQGPVLALLTEESELRLRKVRKKKNLLTGKVTSSLSGGQLQLSKRPDSRPLRLMMTGLGDNVVVSWEDGHVERVDSRQITEPVLTETIDLFDDPSIRLTAMDFMIGRNALVSGDSRGRINIWFRVTDEDNPGKDKLVLAHEMPSRDAAVTSLSSSPRGRVLMVGYADGAVAVMHTTSEQLLAESRVSDKASAVTTVAVSPKQDGLIAATEGEVASWFLHAPHPEATWSTLFGKVWYEGYDEPAHVWQSSSGTQEEEPKYGMTPLIFGTIKATVYSMFFGAPLALLAAIYTSEFLHPRVKAVIKPTVELMASLPSVVLGFLAALVFAPQIEKSVPTALTSFFTIPFLFLVGAQIWQLIPKHWTLVLQQIGVNTDKPSGANPVAWMLWLAGKVMFYLGGVRLIALMVLVFGAIGLAWLLSPLVEGWLFAGDVMLWLDGQKGNGVGGWMFILMPAVAVLISLAFMLYLNPTMRALNNRLSRPGLALLSIAKFLVGSLLTVLLAWLISAGLTMLSDPRGGWNMGSISLSPTGTYDSRNAIIVGFVMGFAIIPIIYTIAEDALSAVPEHLRSGSLGAGATPWQTAVRIIVPTAMSGLFSALMIGLGRAVGETMIVLMAAGNTPLMEMNLFNGFRTLSANIAVELPEAVKDSTHYRTLFFAALSLFVMTFLVNTVAETVRLRFRKRAVQL